MWVSLIGLMGVDAETGMFMLLYLNIAYEDRKNRGSGPARKYLLTL